ncbi:hypothetical protein MLGJGCBP_03115 [Rhodococcus sp. T7]|nr:hypothetical protein MLGJGCBP_03115 [Rhodococcus sp. T7]
MVDDEQQPSPVGAVLGGFEPDDLHHDTVPGVEPVCRTVYFVCHPRGELCAGDGGDHDAGHQSPGLNDSRRRYLDHRSAAGTGDAEPRPQNVVVVEDCLYGAGERVEVESGGRNEEAGL